MTGIMLAGCAGVIAALWLPVSSHAWTLLVAAGVAFACSALGISRPAHLSVLALLLAAGTGLLVGQGSLSRHRLDQLSWLSAQGPIQVTGSIQSLPRCNPRSCRFQLRPEGPDSPLLSLTWRRYWQTPGENLKTGPDPGPDPGPDLGPEPRAGDQCHLTVTLRPSWSLLNPAGFDQEGWAFTRGIAASGQVVEGHCRPAASIRGRIHRWRETTSRWLDKQTEGPAKVLLPALLTADRRRMDAEQWRILSATGTAHLMAISGLHISLVAAAGLLPAYGLFALWRRCPVPRRLLVAGFSALFAVGYATMAGWPLSTQRAAVMLCVPLAAALMRQPWQPVHGLVVALALVLFTTPQAAVGPSLWLSFAAVGVLFLGLADAQTRTPSGRSRNAEGRAPGWRQLLPLQLKLLLGMLPLQLALNLPVSAGFVLVNLVAVPWVTLLILPLALVGAALAAAGLPWLLDLSGWNLNLLWSALVWADSHLQASPLAFEGSRVLLALWCLVLLLPRGLPGWPVLLPAAALVGLSLTLNSPVEHARLHVFDVGQGTSVLLDQEDESMLVDTGPGAADGWNAGAAVIAPSLAALGQPVPNYLVLSHADADHAGGLIGLERGFDRFNANTQLRGVSPNHRWPRCLAGQRWRIGSTQVRTWHPGPWLPYLGNDSSCVLTIRTAGHQVVLPGDAGTLIEQRLLATPGFDQPITGILVLGHHGSRTSSSYAFLSQLNPALVVATVGHQNRFDMPHPSVRRRLGRLKIPLLSSAECGYLGFSLEGDSPTLRHAARIDTARAWHWPGLCPEPTPPEY